MRNQISEYIGQELAKITKANGYQTDFSRLTYWQDTPTEYKENHLDYRDVAEIYSKKNSLYLASVNFEVTAVVIEENGTTAQILGNLALEDLIKCVRSFSICNYILVLKRSHKYVETKGKTACCIELQFIVKYKF